MYDNNHTNNIDLKDIENQIGVYNDYPKKGVLFYDIFPLLQVPKFTNFIVNEITTHITQTFSNLTHIVGIISVRKALESRGFLLGPIIAINLNVSFVPIRKKNKLPGDVESVSYQKEYGEDFLEIQKHVLNKNSKVIVFDDLLATGGTALASDHLISKLGAEVMGFVFIIEILQFRSSHNIKKPYYSVIKK